MGLDALAQAVEGGAGPTGPGHLPVGEVKPRRNRRRRFEPGYRITGPQADALDALAAELRAALAEAGLSATAVARRAGNRRLAGLLSPRGVRPDARRPRPSTLRTIADLCGLPDGTADRWAATHPAAIAQEPST